MSKIISLISNFMARKKVEENVVLDTLPEEVVEVRDEEFHKKHTGAQDNIIYG